MCADGKRISPLEVVVFANGDSADIRTWSNVPYLCTRALESGGCVLRRVDIGLASRGLWRLVGKACNAWLRLWERATGRRTDWSVTRSAAYGRAVRRHMAHEAARWPGADAQLVFGFDFVASGLPSVMLCDWTYQYLVEVREGREPGEFERRFIARQNGALRSAGAVVALFPESAARIRHDAGAEALCFGCPANAACDWEDFRCVREELGAAPSRVLFVGRPAYAPGLRALVEAVTALRAEGLDVGVDVIGMGAGDVLGLWPGTDLSGVEFHGYLDKGDDSQRALYYRLFARARVLVNTTAGWAGASSVMEALWCGVPVVVSENVELRALLGEGPWVEHLPAEDPAALACSLRSFFALSDGEWERLSNGARAFAEPNGWDSFAARLCELLGEVARRDEVHEREASA